MPQYNECPRCGESINADRVHQKAVVCQSCGWRDLARDDRYIPPLNRKTITALSILAIAFVAGFIHMVNWGSHSLAVIPLKLKLITSTAQTQDYRRLADICHELGKVDCLESLWADASRKNPDQLKNIASLGKVFFMQNKLQPAFNAYSQYFSAGGKSFEAAYDYARVLGQMGNTDEAIKYYNYIIQSRPDILQVTVTRSLIDLLVKEGRLKQARQLIESTQKKGSNTSHFLSYELRQIKKRMAVSSI